jgi:hypothetical protein
MPCVFPIPAFRGRDGSIDLRQITAGDVRVLSESQLDRRLSAAEMLLPCGSCVGCQISRAREWAIRCSLEQQLHVHCSFLTLTYSDKYCPPTLSRDHFSLFGRYLRRYVPGVRYFGCGEYGERRGRPHYHALVFGSADREAFERAWGRKGFVTAEPVTPARISYTAGYCAKKLGFHRPKGEEVDFETGEVYTHQPPFLQMSRNPGIGGDFRRHWRSWRRSAIWQGRPFPVPRFLHASWREHADDSAKAALELEKVESRGVLTVRELGAARDISLARIRLRSERSQL